MDFSVLSGPSILQNAAILTIIVAFTGYAITFLSAHMLARRRDKLELVNKRLNEFYGPLYVASQAGNIAYRSLLSKQGKTKSDPITDEEMKDWMLWMRTIFMPLNDIREKIIIEKAHLIVEEQMPQCLLDFVTHVVGYKAVLCKWTDGDYSERRSTIGWPPEFDAYVTRSYAGLKAEQTRLMHSAVRRAWDRAFRSKKPWREIRSVQTEASGPDWVSPSGRSGSGQDLGSLAIPQLATRDASSDLRSRAQQERSNS